MRLRNFLVMLFLLGGAVFLAACEGEMGPAGKDGAKGDKGDPGVAGPKGDKGDKGDPGGDPAPTDDPRCDRSDGINAVRGVRLIQGTADDDVICGNDDTNEIRAGDGDDVVYGEGGDDYIRGGAGTDTLYGGDGSEDIYGDAGNDELHGGGGTDFFFITDPGDDTFNGGLGRDMLFFSGPPAAFGGNISSDTRKVAVTFDLSSETFTHATFGNDTFESIEDVAGSRGDDHITGDDGDNVLIGWYGADTLIGGKGDDTIEPSPLKFANGSAGTADGGEGNDTLIVYGGQYFIQGNTYTVDGTGHRNEFDLTDSTHTSNMSNFENLSAVLASFRSAPRISSVTFKGDSKANTLTGGNAGDTLEGRGGNDTLRGGKGEDNLNGGAGNDVLIGEEGADNLTGGAGNDTFLIRKADGGVDIITDFTLADDKIQFSGFAAGARALTNAAGKISVGAVEVVEIRVSGSANNDRAGNIISQNKYEFVD